MRHTRSALLPSFNVLTTIFATLILCILNFSVLSFAAAPQSNTGSVTLHGQRPGWALPENDRGQVAGDTMLEHLTLILKRSPQQQQAFELFLQQLQDRSSSNYHHFLTPKEIGKKFGVSQQDIDAVSGWLVAQGLRVDSVSNSRVMIDFSGTASLIGAAFSTQMRYYEVNGEQRIATATDPQIPATLAGVIQSVSGLYTIRNRPLHGMGQARKLRGGGFASPDLTFGCPSCNNFIMPADFATIYDLNGLTVDGTGQNVGIIGRSRVYEPDITNFQNLSGLTENSNTPTVIIPPDGVDPGPAAGPGGNASGDQGEATLDVMRSSSIAPGATIDLIVSASTQTEDGVNIAVEYAVDNNPVPIQIMSISFGSCENPAGGGGGQPEDSYWDSLFSQAAGEGISVFVAAGDAGAAGCDSYFQQTPAQQYLSINSICASSYSTCVGGTEFNDVPESQYWNENGAQAPPYESALGYIPEGAWNEPSNGEGGWQAAAGGGGYSLYIPTPSWQTGTGVPGTQGRYTPDIAFSAAAHDGYFGCLAAAGGTCVVQDGEFSFVYFSGTSADAPSMAGITALLNQKEQGPQGELNQQLYQLAATPTNLVFNDITVSSSGVSPCAVTTPSMCNNSTPAPNSLTGGLAGYLVTAGYDEATGLGSINGANLLSNWANQGLPSTTTTVTSSQNPQTQGVSVTFTATVTTLGSNTPTGTVTFYDGNTQIGTGTLSGSGNTATTTLATSTLAVGSNSITAGYSGDSNNHASTSTALNQIINGTFSFTSDGSMHTVLAGQTTSTSTPYTFVATPTSASTFGATVTFACSFAPTDPTLTNASCTFNPASIAAGAGATSVAMIITTKGPNTGIGNVRSIRRRADNRSPWLPLTLPLAGIVVAGLAGRKVWKHSAVASLCVSLMLLGLLVACGGSSAAPIIVGVQESVSSLYPNYTDWPSQTGTFTATVTGTTNQNVTWGLSTSAAGVSCTAASNPCGSLTSANPTMYTAPTIAPGLPSSIVVTATSQADTTKNGQTSLNLSPATVPNAVTVPPTTGYTVTVTALEANTAVSATPNVSLVVN